MHTEAVESEPIALFFFAHQDDEFGVFHAITEERRKGRRVVCCYLTDGGFGGVSVQRRNDESLTVLSKLGVAGSDVVFAGEMLSISDGRLVDNLDAAGAWIENWVAGFKAVQAIYVTAWEGGHHDHDALHALVAIVSHRLGCLLLCRQFSLYNAYRCKGPLFRVQLPLVGNGPVTYTPIPWHFRMRFIGYCLGYPSQTKTWLGLLPFVVAHYVLDGRQATQPLDLTRLLQRPHDGALYYEKREFCQWEKLLDALQVWRRQFERPS
ncbi:PIG-L deacetylase family protein [Achromobacter marplatensis]|uniref:PIG-L deacetylase family protein n=1 Tax=Achromobacter marplatensis TaxID=470868 RepID=UPI0039F6E873